MEFNKNHPEKLEGETFVGNTFNSKRKETSWDNKIHAVRLGKVGYDVQGTAVDGLYPMFIKKST